MRVREISLCEREKCKRERVVGEREMQEISLRVYGIYACVCVRSVCERARGLRPTYSTAVVGSMPVLYIRRLYCRLYDVKYDMV